MSEISPVGVASARIALGAAILVPTAWALDFENYVFDLDSLEQEQELNGLASSSGL